MFSVQRAMGAGIALKRQLNMGCFKAQYLNSKARYLACPKMSIAGW